ncbi:MAG: iron-sulfur cluster assembly accessory protein [Gammaproteobacteria bacterium]|nr:iron-sulfur cluster assembly accessory protein [Gammaproteobacteria bacterium]
MITVTHDAAKQIRHAAKQGRMEGLPLRLAAKRDPQGEFHYAMGFADDEQEGDMRYQTEGIEIVVSPFSLELLKNTVLDYVQLDDGEYHFIFRNPNDPNYQPAAHATQQ